MTINSALVERGAVTPPFAGDAAEPAPPASVVKGRSRAAVGALIVGGSHGSLCVARSLGRQGIKAAFVGNEPSIAQFSHYVTNALSWGGPDQAGAAAELMDIGRRHGLDGWLLIPGADSEARLLSQHKAELSTLFRLKLPDWDAMQWAYDKTLTYERAAALGIGFPLSYKPHTPQDVVGLDCKFPLILKPTARERKNAFTRAKAWQVDDREALIARYQEAFTLVGADGIVLQELIPGGGEAQFSYAAVWHCGAPVASLVARRRRQFPIDFGLTSTFVETIENDEVEAMAVRFLKSIDYDGMVEIEFKYDSRDGRYKILDVNARSWTWCALGGLAGVDFPYILWGLAMGEQVPPCRGRAGATWMLGIRDLMAAAQGILAGVLTARGYVQSLRTPMVFGAYTADDMLPGAMEIALGGWHYLKRRVSR
jgi:D-aspartate ligase